jgi:hypothetical protein
MATNDPVTGFYKASIEETRVLSDGCVAAVRRKPQRRALAPAVIPSADTVLVWVAR